MLIWSLKRFILGLLIIEKLLLYNHLGVPDYHLNFSKMEKQNLQKKMVLRFYRRHLASYMYQRYKVVIKDFSQELHEPLFQQTRVYIFFPPISMAIWNTRVWVLKTSNPPNGKGIVLEEPTSYIPLMSISSGEVSPEIIGLVIKGNSLFSESSSSTVINNYVYVIIFTSGRTYS